MLRTHVLPALASPAGFLRQRALWMYGEFSPSVFNGKNEASSNEASQMMQAFPVIVEMMRDAELPVRVQVRRGGAAQ